ncbi:MAG: 1-acyl-sn-glycerol-3-phosphate acyltransferase [Actinomycetia bacterium]|nr:1-acyl-sn-glycerol-3-phosphate acyltransferase [Actinomycetes bacterium]
MKPLDYFYDNPASGEGHWPQRFAKFFFAVVRLVFGLLFRYKVAGQEVFSRLPADGGAIVAGNHHSYLDPVFALIVMRPRLLRFMAKQEYFDANRVIARLTSWVGAFPVKRDSADMQAVKRSVRMLKRGELVGIFPEGTRQRFPGQQAVYHEGIALIAALADTPVVPMRIWGTERIKPYGKRMFRLPKISVRFGEPLVITEEPFASLPKDQRQKAFTEEVMRRVYALAPLPNTPEARAAERGR